MTAVKRLLRVCQALGARLATSPWFTSMALLLIGLATARLIDYAIGSHHFLEVLLTLGSLIIFSSYRVTYRWIVLPLSVLLAAYFPIGRYYGMPSYQFISSLLATNLQESYEFLGTFPFYLVLLASLIPIGCYLIYRLLARLHFTLSSHPIFLFCYGFVALALCDMGQFGHRLQAAIHETHQEQKAISAFSQQVAWQNVHTLPTSSEDAQTYVLVIGESLRRDYMQVYGYPVANTPFLAQSPGLFIRGLHSANVFTIGSLRLMLTQGYDGQPNYSKTIVGLANQAGFETYWISNQGSIGEHDTPVTAIASQAQHRTFIHPGDYTFGNYPDFALLSPIQRVLQQKSTKKRLIIVHLLGSHPDVCQRARYSPQRWPVDNARYREVECYVASIRATDAFLEKLTGLLQATQAPYSLLFFADHGLSHRVDASTVTLDQSRPGRFHTDVPLILLGSHWHQHQEVNVHKNGRQFIQGLASWLNLTADGLTPRPFYQGDDAPFDPYRDNPSMDPQYVDRPIDITHLPPS